MKEVRSTPSRSLPTYRIRRARVGEAEWLSELTYRSKAHWGYSESFMQAFLPLITITEDYLSKNIAFVAEAKGEIAGWASMFWKEPEPCLDYLFVEPKFIGKGCGLALWKRVVREAKILGWRTFQFTADDNAEGFYLKLGALRIGETEFKATPGRKVPVMRYRLK